MTEPEFVTASRKELFPPSAPPPVPPSAGMAVVLLVFASVCLLLLSVLFTSQVTSGPVMVGAAILLAVLARISQAGAHHREQWAWRQKTDQ
jgi:hypothetical protein